VRERGVEPLQVALLDPKACPGLSQSVICTAFAFIQIRWFGPEFVPLFFSGRFFGILGTAPQVKI
jgi:hypothetical protein